MGRTAMLVALQLAAPILVVGMAVGLFISLFQAVTQIQEQTLTFVPKMIAMAMAVILFMPWFLATALEFASSMLGYMHVEP